MSIVRYTNKKTGKVTVYESTSNYDPVLKQSRPKRRYLGMEDPETGEIIPSSKKRGRKKADAIAQDTRKLSDRKDYRQLYESAQHACSQKDAEIKALKREKMALYEKLRKIQKELNQLIGTEG